MRITTSMRLFAVLATMALLLSGVFLFAQETTGGLQGTVKDASGAVVSGAHVVVKESGVGGRQSPGYVNRLDIIGLLTCHREFMRSR